MPFTGVVPQTFPHRSTGATLVRFGNNETDGRDSGHDDAMVDLGYCEDRVQIEERPQWEDIKNDIFGGQAGIPSEAQYLGSVAYIHCNLNRFSILDVKNLAGIHPALSALVAGFGGVSGGPMGAFMRQGDNNNTHYMETLELSSQTEVLRFHKAFLRQGRRFNMGVRHQQFSLVFEAHVFSPCDMELYEIVAGVNPCT